MIIPVKGNDINQKENFESIKRQDYKDYDIVAVADSKDDPGIKAAKELGIKTLIAKGPWLKSSGKTRAIAYTLRKMKGYEIYAIADSDIKANRDWLSKLIEPFSCGDVYISTTFPIFLPIRPRFWSYVKEIWGLVGEGLLESELTRFGWGGSLAFRRELADSRLIHLLTDSKYSLSDDISITKRVKEIGKKIEYVKDAAPIVYVDENFKSFIEWANRQTALTILGYKKNLYFGYMYYGAEAILFGSGIIGAFAVSPLFSLLLAHFVISEAKTIKRVKRHRGRTSLNEIALFFAIVAIMPFLYLYKLRHASHMEHIEWRGRKYRVK